MELQSEHVRVHRDSQIQAESDRWTLLNTAGNIWAVLLKSGSILFFWENNMVLMLTTRFQTKPNSKVAFDSQKQIRGYIEIFLFSKLGQRESCKLKSWLGIGEDWQMDTGLPDFHDCNKRTGRSENWDQETKTSFLLRYLASRGTQGKWCYFSVHCS